MVPMWGRAGPGPRANQQCGRNAPRSEETRMSNLPPYQHRSRSIAGCVAFVTGAASGMGRATAHLFAREGAKVAISDLTQEGVDAVAAEIAEARRDDPSIGEVIAFAMDVSKLDAIQAGIKRATDHFGGLDILVNNAGFSAWAPVDEPDAYETQWARALDGMLTAHQRTIRTALPWLRKSENPRIVNIASTEGLGATPGNTAYVAAKHGVIGLTRGFACDLGPEGITVNAICPGPIRSGITERIPEEHKVIYAKRRTALKRYGDPEDIANGVLSFALPSASYITGTALPVDGGLTIRRA